MRRCVCNGVLVCVGYLVDSLRRLILSIALVVVSRPTVGKKNPAFCSQVIASWIYSASTLHAAVNFPQKPSMSFVPSCPSSMFAPPPTDKVSVVVVVVIIGVVLVCCLRSIYH